MKNFILTGWPFVHLWRSEGPGGQGGRDKKEKELGEKIVRITSTYKLTEQENWSMDVVWSLYIGLALLFKKKLLLNLSCSSR